MMQSSGLQQQTSKRITPRFTSAGVSDDGPENRGSLCLNFEDNENIEGTLSEVNWPVNRCASE